jgi:hypothetical protein
MDDVLLDLDARRGRRTPSPEPLRDVSPPLELLRLYYAINGMRAVGDPIVLQMLSATRGEGTSTIVTALAGIAACDRDQQVLALDCSSRNEADHPPRRSLIDCFRSGQPLFQGASSQDGGGLGRYRAARLSVMRHPLLGLPLHEIRELFDMIRKVFAFTLLDCGATADCPDGVGLARHCDGTVLVVRAGAVPSGTVQALRTSIERAGGQVVGVVLNRHRQHVPAWLARRL